MFDEVTSYIQVFVNTLLQIITDQSTCKLLTSSYCNAIENEVLQFINQGIPKLLYSGVTDPLLLFEATLGTDFTGKGGSLLVSPKR